jgi:hypothetical protein
MGLSIETRKTYEEVTQEFLQRILQSKCEFLGGLQKRESIGLLETCWSFTGEVKDILRERHVYYLSLLL